MVQAIVNLTEHENRIINIIKGKYGFRNKSETIEFIINEYEKDFLEPELRPEYVEKIKNIEKGKMTKIKDFREYFGVEEEGSDDNNV